MESIGEVCMRWVEVNTSRPDAKVIRSDNVWFSGPTIYSYGTHWALAQALKEGGRTRLWLINGEASPSHSTGRHQREVRDAIGRSQIPSVIIPFSVLDAAGIIRDSVRVLEVLPDRWETTSHETFQRPEGAVWRDDPVSTYVDLDEAELQGIVDRKNASSRQQWEQRKRWADEEPEDGTWRKWLERNPHPRVHGLDSVPGHERREWRVVGHVQRLYRDRHFTDTYDVEVTPAGTLYKWETRRHWLGESLIEATVRDERRFTCRLCNGSRRHPDAPPRPQERPHDPLLSREEALADRARRIEQWPGLRQAQDEWDAEWGWPNGKRCPRCKGRGTWTRRFDRRRKFLSGFDRGEQRPSYFFCELPVTDAATVEEALEALKPETVRMAEQMGRPVYRQGDIFAVQLSAQVTKRRLRRQGATFTRMGGLLGTNHCATEVAMLPDGTTLARGILHHVPQWRGPDHARVKLGSGFHVIVKNTVPLTV
jgi:hypothetical protein